MGRLTSIQRLNTLQTLTGIDEKTAKRIIEHRENNGAFKRTGLTVSLTGLLITDCVMKSQPWS